MPKTVQFNHEKVLQQVMVLFWEKGYNGTSMQELVDTTGLNRSSIYNTFGDKLQLFLAALQRYQSQQNDLLRKAFADAKSPREAISLLFQDLGGKIVFGDQLGCLLTNSTTELASNESTVANFLADNKQRVVGAFAALIEGAQQLGEISADRNPKILALYLFTTLQGLHVVSFIENDLSEVTEEILKGF